jgi:cyclopropane fatty-acyl-phospholipid synthase-like methyltransferase
MIGILKRIKRRVYLTFQNRKEKRHSNVGLAHLWKMKQDFQIKFLIQQGLMPNDTLLDLGCGTLRGGIPIIRHLEEGNYYGIELRENVLEEGKKELRANKLEYKNPQLFSFSDFTELEFKVSFDKIFAFSVLIHMEDHIVQKCFEFVRNNLSETGVFYANVNIEPHANGNWQGFPVVFRSLEFYEELALQNNLTVISLGRLKDLGHNSGQELADMQVMLEINKT